MVKQAFVHHYFDVTDIYTSVIDDDATDIIRRDGPSFRLWCVPTLRVSLKKSRRVHNGQSMQTFFTITVYIPLHGS